MLETLHLVKKARYSHQQNTVVTPRSFQLQSATCLSLSMLPYSLSLSMLPYSKISTYFSSLYSVQNNYAFKFKYLLTYLLTYLPTY